MYVLQSKLPKTVLARLYNRLSFGFVICVVSAVLCVGFYKPALSAVERYGYDPIGRLIQFIDSSGRVTEYTYDAAGNITSVRGGGAVSDFAPVLSSVAPNVIRRGETISIVLLGQRLQAGSLETSHPGLSLLNLQQTPTEIRADLRASEAVPLGAQTITYTNAAGSSSVGVTVAPALPVLAAEPSPLALPPDNLARGVTLRLSAADAIPHTVNLAFSDADKAFISPASVTFAAGQTSVLVSVTPRASGFSTLQLTSSTLASVAVPVFVTSDFRGVNTSNAQHVGVVVEGPATQQPSAQALFSSPNVGVVVGSVLSGVSPKGMQLGSAQNLLITGNNIPAGATVALLPDTGTTLGVPVVAGNGSQINVDLTIDAAAAIGPRGVVVRDATGKVLPFVNPASAQVVFTAGPPTLYSVEPLFGAAGSLVELKVRGANLHGAKVAVLPAIDLGIDSQPIVNESGTELLVRVQVFPFAASGARVVQITTPSGQSSATPSSFNQFTVVSEIQNDITPIIAPTVGVMVGAGAGGGGMQTITPVAAPSVGVVTGAAAISVSPNVGVVGTSVNLIISGVGLQVVQSVDVVSPDGLTTSAFTVNAQGTVLTLPIAIDAAAPKTRRKIVLRTATGTLPFAQESGATFLVAAQAPEVDSATPQVLQAGTNAALTLRGRNFRDVLGVRFEPADGVAALQNLVANAEGTVLTVPVSVAANASTGPRTLVVLTAGGESSSVSLSGNTVQVAQQAGPTYESITASLVGVRVGSAVQPPVSANASFIAPLVGVVVQGPEVPPTTSNALFTAPHVGVLVGAAASSMAPASPDGFLAGTTGQLTINGIGLNAVTGITAAGATGVSFGSISVNQAGTQITVPVTVAGSVVSGGYAVGLTQNQNGTVSKVTSLQATAPFSFSVGTLPSQIDSMGPIVLEQGESYTFTVRGTNLKDVYQLQTDPVAGLVFGPVQWGTDLFGEKLTVPLTVGPSATIGSRVVRLRVPGGLTTGNAQPANTVTVVAPFEE